MKIEGAKEHIGHVLKIRDRKKQVKSMKEFWEWVAAMPEFQRRIYLQDLVKAEHSWLDDNQKMEIRALREEAMINLPGETRTIIEKSFENLHEETHIEKQEPLE